MKGGDREKPFTMKGFCRGAFLGYRATVGRRFRGLRTGFLGTAHLQADDTHKSSSSILVVLHPFRNRN